MQHLKQAFLFLLFLAAAQTSFAQDDLEKYITRLKISEAVNGSETAAMSAGSFFLYGQAHFENKNYVAAAHFFRDALSKDPGNACVSYQLGLCLLRQNDPSKNELAWKHLNRAFTVYPSLKERFAKENLPVTGTTGETTRLESPKATLPW